MKNIWEYDLVWRLHQHKNMTDVTENQTDVAAQAVLDKKSIDKCTKGLVDKFNSPVQGIDVSNKHHKCIFG